MKKLLILVLMLAVMAVAVSATCILNGSLTNDAGLNGVIPFKFNTDMRYANGSQNSGMINFSVT